MTGAVLGALGLGTISVAFLVASLAAASGVMVAPDTEAGSSPTTSSSRMGVAQIGALAEAAGFQGNALAMAIAIALAESGGNPAATDHDANGTVDRGLWQINSVNSEFSAACDYDPACSASAAYSISDGGRSWSAWVTYDRGEEIPFLPAALAWVSQQASTT